MRVALLLAVTLTACVRASILQNGQPRIEVYPNTSIKAINAATDLQWKTYQPNATQISYKGRWDAKYTSWWSVPGVKFGFTGDRVAISFGEQTTPGVLVGYRFSGQDWQFSNVSAGTHQLISAATPGFNLSLASQPQTFELRVSNWAYGVQITGVHVAANASLVRLPDYGRRIEIIGDSISSGMYNSYEGLSSWAWNLAEGFGQTEFSVTAYPGICLSDQDCWGNPRGHKYMWYRIPDTSPRAQSLYGRNLENAPLYDFGAHPAADLVIFYIGTNDNNAHNNVTKATYYNSYINLIEGIHGVWPKAKIIVCSLYLGFTAVGSSYAQRTGLNDEIYRVYEHFKDQGYVEHFNTTGILQHNDIAPGFHPTDTAQLKVASHLMQYIKIKHGWDLLATGPEVQHNTLYWNDEPNY